MTGDFFAYSRHGGIRNRVASFVLAHPTQSLVSAALLALLLAPGAAFAWRLQTASPNAATTNAFPKQSSTTTFDAAQLEPLTAGSAATSQESTSELKASVSAGDGGTTVQVNGHTVPVPEDGTTHTIVDNNGTTVVDVTINTTGGTNSSYSSTSINLNTSSESTIDTENSFE
jgi:hypothetical protein